MNILVFGDSITQGFYDDEKAGWVARLFAYGVAKNQQPDYEKHISVFNLGISGERSCDVIERFDAEFSARQEQGMVTMFAVGVNDSARQSTTDANWCDIKEYRSNLQQMIDQAKSQGPVVLIGLTALDEKKLVPIPWFSKYSHYQADRDRYDEVLKELTDTNECVYIQTVDLFLGYKDELLLDGLHPNAKGHQLIFERVAETLERENIL